MAQPTFRGSDHQPQPCPAVARDPHRGELRAGILNPRHEELPPLGRAAGDLAESIADVELPPG